MKKPMKKSAKITIGVLIAVLLIGVCFTSVALYAKKELSKPRFTLPETAPLPSASSLPATAAEAETYLSRLFAKTTAADDVEGTWQTDVAFDGDWETPLTGADERVLRYIASRAQAQIGALYPSADAVCMAQADDIPEPLRGASDVSFTAEQGEGDDEDRYRITLDKTPAQTDASAVTDDRICTAVQQTVSPAAKILRVQITLQNVKETYTIDRVTDDLLSAEFVHTYQVRAEVRLQGAYCALLPTRETVAVTLPYTTTTQCAFRRYGVRFTEQAVAVRPGDRQSLPATFAVRDAKAAEEYSLTFTPNVPDVLSFDDDGVMSVLKLCDKPVTVTMTLQHAGHTYTDSITVYITEWEVASDV